MLEARDVSFAYEATTPILSDWSARFEAGAVTAITGPSGRGKSTLLYLLGLMLTPQSGDIVLDGESISGLSDARRAAVRARDYGFVFQDAALDSTRTVLDNVVESSLYRGEPRDTALSRAKHLLESFGVQLRASAKPGQVSGGQAQRIAMCRALLSSPRVLLADEPTGNLDPESARVVMAAFKEHAGSGNAVIVVTHDPAVVEWCDLRISI